MDNMGGKILKNLLDKKWIILILIPLIITTVIRLQPMKLVPLDRAAESSVLDFYRSQIRTEILKQYPNYKKEQQEAIIEQKIQEILSNENNKKLIDEQIKQSAVAMKSRVQYESGNKKYPYLGDIDSYYWIRMSRNIVEKGTQCDVIQDKVCYDSYTLAPNLRRKFIDYYPVVIVWIYKIIKPFNPDITIMQASFLTPLFFSLLLTIPLFLLLRKIGGNITAIIGTILVNVNPFILNRSLGSDNDIVNVFFQAFFLWLVIECFYAKNYKTKYIWSFLVGVLLSIYSKFWTGWWYLADLFILSIVLSAIYIIVHKWYDKKKINMNELKKPLLNIGLILVSFIISLIIFYEVIFASPANLLSVLNGQFAVLKFKVATNPNFWPNVLTTVAEFNSMGLPEIISSFGTILHIPLFLMAILGTIFLICPTTSFIKKNFTLFLILLIFDILLYYFLKSSSTGTLVFLLLIPIFIGIYAHLKIKEDVEFHPDAVFLLTMIICLVVYFTMTGVRFLFLMAIPVSIFVALFITRILRIIILILKKMLNLPKIIAQFFMLVLVLWILIAPVKAGFNVAQNYMPNVTDEWVETLEKIKSESKLDAIINSWWDFGHWFKYFADRRVTLDGASQNSPQLHWLGKLLLTSDENMSRGILRMLDCGGNNAFETINEKMNDTPHSIDILNAIIAEKKNKAKEILTKHNFNSEEIEKVLNYSHCNPPENYLITSEDMIGKSGVWAHFGSWNFKRSYLSAVVSEMPEQDIIDKFKEDYEIDEKTTRGWISELSNLKDQNKINAWIAPWPNYFSKRQGCNKQGNVSVCQFSQGDNIFQVVIDFDNKKAYVVGPDKVVYYPRSVAFVQENSFDLIKNRENTLGFGIATIKNNDNVEAVFMAPELTGSMFTRLFFFEGIGLNSFQKYYDITSLYGERIITWKIIWDKED